MFALDAAGNTSATNSGADATAPKPAAPVHTAPAPQPPSPTSSGGWLSSTLLRMVAVVGLLMLLVMAGADRRDTPAHAHVGLHAGPREVGPRMAMTGVAPVALVIPALLVLGSCAAIALVLLNL